MNKKEYDKKVEKEASKFDLTAEDLHNLYDLMYITDFGDVKNNFEDWFYDFFDKIEEIVVPELKNTED